MQETAPAQRRRIGIATQVFIGLGLGVFVGLFFGEKVAFLQIGGDLFIALLQITVIPYVVVALIASLGQLTLEQGQGPRAQGRRGAPHALGRRSPGGAGEPPGVPGLALGLVFQRQSN